MPGLELLSHHARLSASISEKILSRHVLSLPLLLPLPTSTNGGKAVLKTGIKILLLSVLKPCYQLNPYYFQSYISTLLLMTAQGSEIKLSSKYLEITPITQSYLLVGLKRTRKDCITHTQA